MHNKFKRNLLKSSLVLIGSMLALSCSNQGKKASDQSPRERISINKGWSFYKYESAEDADSLIYDLRPEVEDKNDNKAADTKPTEAIEISEGNNVLKAWILPTGNEFIEDPSKQHIRPEGNPGQDFPFVQIAFNDDNWRKVDLPHDWGIEGPFLEGWDAEVGGGMGRLPSHGIAWYRKKLNIDPSDAGKTFYLDIDGAMSYAMVWCNGNLVGGWPYGYNSWRVDLTPYIQAGDANQLAIRVDNPNYSARWYPGGGIYRNVWLVKTGSVHVAHWGTYVTTENVTTESATINLDVTIDNKSDKDESVEVNTEVYPLDENGIQLEVPAVAFKNVSAEIKANQKHTVKGSVTIDNPALWGPAPTQTPNLYVAVTRLSKDGKIIDEYKTRFGIRSVEFDPDKGIIVNGERIPIKGINNHHDLGALGSAFNIRAAERQLEILKEMGCNSIRMSHNPPAPELLELTDKMGFLVMDEIFDSWELKKTPHDFHLIFPDWYEADTRAYIRRDRNCPSIIMWSYGNEVGEQYTGEEGAAIGRKLCDIINEEDSTRKTAASMNWAKSYMPFPEVMDVISLNYQGEGIRQDPFFEGTERIQTPPSYDDFHEKFPDKVILSTETASSLSTRGTYLFPVSEKISAPIREGLGGDEKNGYVSAYELYAVDFGSSADKVFAAIDSHPFVAGEFVWTGWDYIGEPSPYYLSRSSYSGMIDLAGFPKDRYYLYQAKWRPDLPMVHILPHWNWPDRVGKVTPVHVFTSGDEVELFLNGKSLGKKKKGEYEYRLRWDDVVYEPGELKAVSYKDGKQWAEQVMKTTDAPAKLEATADRSRIKADGLDLSFITVKVCDKDDLFVANASDLIEFSIEGPGEIVATDNGDPTDMNIFSSHQRKAFSGKALVIVKAKEGETGEIIVKAKAEGLDETSVTIKTE